MVWTGPAYDAPSPHIHTLVSHTCHRETRPQHIGWASDWYTGYSHSSVLQGRVNMTSRQKRYGFEHRTDSTPLTCFRDDLNDGKERGKETHSTCQRAVAGLAWMQDRKTLRDRDTFSLLKMSFLWSEGMMCSVKNNRVSLEWESARLQPAARLAGVTTFDEHACRFHGRGVFLSPWPDLSECGKILGSPC